ncbi:sulfotransferase domain-containing protein [Shewanella sp. Scap07]|uniref:sulfotransferase domain-containing protein n=1 Tax=Shewanella sp. Scap07 TaxID=2589987 RepID=UPI0015BAFE32|nr:sulfotransferase domain-containing protein [Shewanella sp. Scap07]QLE86095.1 sulfotransferase domain-containing protein [Shewanella sp. Scap07]
MKIDFCIIGAPKCGTTSLAYFLSKNPQVDFCKIKEPFYFNQQSPKFNGVKSAKKFEKLFRNDGGLKGEGSTWYLYSEDAIENILKHNPSAKFIVCVRDIVDAVVSWHGHMRLVGAEPEPDFVKAWQREPSEILKTRVYGTNEVLNYRKLFKLGTQVSKLLSKVDSTQVHFISFNDLVQNTGKCYQSTLEFLGLEDDGRTEFPIKYPRVDTKSSIVRYLGSSISYQQRIYLTSVAIKAGVDLYDLYFKFNTSVASRPFINEKLREELNSYFSDELKLLHKYTEIDVVRGQYKNV